MIQISIDDKPVVLNGSKPETVEQLISVIGQQLFDNGRVIKQILVDGEDGTIDEFLLKKRDYCEVKIYSKDRNEDMVEELSLVIENKDYIINFMNQFSRDLLNGEWSSNAHNSNRLSHMTLTIVMLLNRTCDLMKDGNEELLRNIKSLIHSFKVGTNLYTSAMSFKDTLSISDVILEQLIPTVKQALDLFQGPVKSYFDWVTSPNLDFPAS